MHLWIIASVLVFTFAGVMYVYLTRNQFTRLDDFLTGRNHLGTLPATATVFASIMGAWVLFTPAEAGTWGGIAAFGGYAVAQAAAVMLFAVFGPRMRELAPEGTTLFEFVYYRYGKSMYALTLVVGVFYMSVFLAAELTGIALAVNLVAGIPLWITALIIGGGTLIYTTYGGIRGTIFTDTVQTLVVIPTILIAFFATAHFAGGLGGVFNQVKDINPSLLSFENVGGLNFAAVMVIAVIAANMFNQGFWSRVYACRDNRTLRRSFLIGGFFVIPVMVIAGFFGLFAVSAGTLTSPSSALFEVILNVTPTWVINVVIILAVALVMSSVDTMINAIAAVFTVDIARFNPEMSTSRLHVYARVITALICGLVIIIASQGYSVLYLFLLADLACAAAVFPTFYGMYSKRFTGRAAVISVLGGIAAGVPYFPNPAMQGGNLLYCFALALAVSIVLSVVLEKTSRTELNFDYLRETVHDIRS